MWITGQTRAHDVNIELQLMMPLDTLINPMITTPTGHHYLSRAPDPP